MKKALLGESSKFKSCGDTCHEIKENSDNFFDEIEKFLNQYETPSKSPQALKKGRVYTDIDLLNVLDSDNSEKNKLGMSAQNQKPSPPTCSVLPKKRKPPDSNEEPIAKKKLQVAYKSNKEPKKRGRPKKLHKVCLNKYVEPKFRICHRLLLPKKKKVERITHHIEDRLEAKINIVTCRCDSMTIKNIVVKKEVIDLTGDEDLFYAFLKFGKECYVEQETVQPFDVTLHKAKMVDVEVHLNKVSIFVPEIQYDVDNAFIDLTEIDDTESSVVVASEKECANRIVPILHKCHKMYEVNKKLEDALCEMREYLPLQEANEDYLYPFKLFSQNVKWLGFDLIRELSRISVKNLNMSRFIEIVATKLDALVGVSVHPHTVYFYLHVLLNQHRDTCKSRLLEEILEGIDDYGKSLRVKEEYNYQAVEVVFTEEQLIELRSQIEKYIEIDTRQEELLAAYDEDGEMGISAVTKGIKMEMLNLQEGLEYLQCKFENDIICIIDDD